jgi:hypothetical protein
MIATEWMVSPNTALAEQIVQELSDMMPEEGVSVVIFNRTGHCQGSHPEEFECLNLSFSFLEDIMDRIDDGDEPVVTSIGDTCLVASQLTTPGGYCGYVLVVLPKCNIESTWQHLELIEVIMGQIRLLAGHIE